MKDERTLRRLEEVLKSSLNELLPNAIIPYKNGYEAFGEYEIMPEHGVWKVYRCYRDPMEFSSSRVALAWCIAHKLQQIHLYMDIERLDHEKVMLVSDLSVRTRLREQIKNTQTSEIVDVKLSARKHRLEHVETTLTKCVNRAKYLQIRGFNNETARTGRTAPNRTSRQNTA